MTDPETPVVAEPVDAMPPTIVVSRRVVIAIASALALIIGGLVAGLVYLGNAAPKKTNDDVKPITAFPVPAPPVDPALKQAAEAKKQELMQMHARVLQGDSTGVIEDFPKIKTTPAKISPPAIDGGPTMSAGAGKALSSDGPKSETLKGAAEKPTLTPMGRDGLGVSKENLGGLLPAIEAMNAMESRPKKREK